MRHASPLLLATTLALVSGACANELTLPSAPPAPQPGSLSGRATFARPGRDARDPAAGAEIQLLGTSVSTVAGADGYFFLSPIVSSRGTVLIRWDSDKDGTYERQRVVRLEDVGGGPNRPVSLGDVSVAENSRVDGRVRLGDKLEQRGGHAGTLVFVPEAPYLTQTADDGTFALPELPAGALTVAILRDGYEPLTLDGLELQPGQQLALRDQVLQKSLENEGKKGSIEGRVSLQPAPSGNAPITVTAVGPDGHSYAATVHDDGSFEIADMPAGVYQVVVSRPGYVPAVTSGVAVTSGGATTLGDSVLVAGNPPGDCHAGDPCNPDDPCRQGKIQCVAAGAVCVATSDVKAAGASCGRDAVCSPDGACVRCQAKAACTPENSCHAGQLACDDGIPTCRDTGSAVSAGTPCGADEVCSADGECTACDAGSVCELPGALACHIGAVTCTSGGPDCRDIGFYKPAGTSCGEDLVCNPVGSCVSCRDGAACVPADPCHQGVIRCDTGIPRCVDTGALVATGTGCGDGRVCGSDGTCNACETGKSCVPANSCHLGSVSCDSGLPVCNDLGAFAAAGLPCGTDQVCSPDGTCESCATGASCELGDGAPCHLGALGCDTGLPACGDLGILKPAGTACGDGKVCNPGGSCVTCTEGGACTPPNGCHVGVVKCDTGAPRCVDTGAPSTAGKSCGTNLVCDPTGSCVSCAAGASCTPADPCHAGKVICDSGTPQCQDTGTALAAGTGCGQGRVCAPDGSCSACPAGSACQSPVACRAGQVTCDTGLPVCSATSTKLPPGTGCGTNEVCDDAGSCASCTANLDCAVANPCHVGRTSCATGTSTCSDTGAARAAGTSCGTGQVCSSAGACVACNAGAACTPANPCHQGQIDCSTGAPLCTDQATGVADGTTCGTDKVCSAGSCVACAAGGSCTPTNPCHAGAISCSTGTAVCADQATNLADGSACGTNKVCRTGSCVPSGMAITAGDGQTGYAGQLITPVTFHLADGLGNAMVSVAVTVTATPGAVVTLPSPAKTDISGNFTVAVRLGPNAGTYTVSAVAAGGAGRADAVETATAVPAKAISTLINTDHSYSNNQGADGLGGPAAAAHLNTPKYLARASDGTIYVSDVNACIVRRMLPDGTWQHVAGVVGNCTSAGDGGAADKASLAAPAGLALDEGKGLLYVAENTSIGRVRVVDLGRNVIGTMAGGNASAPSPGFGDSGPATSAHVSYPSSVVLTPDNLTLYVFDTGHRMVRKVDLKTTQINTVSNGYTGNCSAPDGIIWGCPGEPTSCSLALDTSGNLFVSGQICGAKVTGQPYGILKVAPDLKQTVFASQPTTGAASGAALGNTAFPIYPFLAFDAAQNLYLSEMSQHRVRMIEAGTGRVVIVAGTGTQGYAGDFVAATSAQLSNPGQVLFEPDGSMLIADSGNSCIRRVSKLGGTTPATPTLSAASATTFTAYPGGLATGSATVQLVDAQGSPLVGYPLTWRAVDPGGAVIATSTLTQAGGSVTNNFRAGIATGSTYRFEATFKDPFGRVSAGSPVQFQVATQAPAAQTVFTVLNVDRSKAQYATLLNLPTASTTAHVGTPRSVAFANDGTMYVVDQSQCVVEKVTAAGDASVFAGTAGVCSSAGDGGPATLAFLATPSGVAVSADQKTVYVSEYVGDNGGSLHGRIRAIDVASGYVSTYAGGGTAPSPGFGDGGPASAAVLAYPSAMVVGPSDGDLYVSDSGNTHTRIRRIDHLTGVISTLWTANLYNCGTAPAQFYGCGINEQGCAFTIDSAGNVFLGAQVCGGVNGSNSANGLLMRDPQGNVTLVAGKYNGVLTDGTVGSNALVEDTPMPALLPDGSVIFSEPAKNRIRRWDPVAKTVSLWTGSATGTAGATADYVPLSSTLLTTPWAPVPKNGHVYLPDTGNAAIRVVW